MSSFYLQNLSDSHLDQVLTWRNQTHIRNMMYTNRLITKSEHEQWYQEVMTNDQIIVKILFKEDHPLGSYSLLIYIKLLKDATGAFISENRMLQKVQEQFWVFWRSIIFLKINRLEKCVLKLLKKTGVVYIFTKS
nr:hypothetical protein [Alkalibacillus haloalkaliphilus]